MTERNIDRTNESRANRNRIDPKAEEAYWHDNFESRPYVEKDDSFTDFGPAFRFGSESYGRSKGRSFDQSEANLKSDWERNKGSSSLTWDRARHATRDAWKRASDAIERAIPGDSDRDGM